MTADSPVNVERFARVYVKGPEELPSHADTYYDAHQGYYFKLHLDQVSAEAASPIIAKANEMFDIDLVRRVTRDGLYKERVYIDSQSEAPGGYKVHTGPNGGLYYETGVQQVASEGSESRNVAVIHWDDVEMGDEIVFETPGGKETFAEIVDIEEQAKEADVIHVEADGEAHQAMPGTYSVENGDTKSEGSLTSTTEGVHNVRYSEDDEEDEDDVGKDCDGHHADSYMDASTRLQPGEVLCEEDGEVYEYGPDETCPGCGEDISDETGVEKEYQGSKHAKRGEKFYCSATDEEWLPDLVESNNEECPGCGDDVNVVGIMTDEKSFPAECRRCGENPRERGFHCRECLDEIDKSFAKVEDQWVSFVGPDGGEGWVNMATGEKRYQKERPGEGPSGHDEPEFAAGWDPAPEDLDQLLEGQTVEVLNHQDEYVEGEYIGVNEQGYHAVEFEDETISPVGPEMSSEITAVSEVGSDHPADPEMISIDPSDGDEFASQFDVGETVALDTSDVPIVDEPVREFEVMGYVQQEPSEGWLAVKPHEEFIDAQGDTTHVAINEDQYLPPEEAEEMLNATDRMDEMGVEIGDTVILDDEDLPGYLRAEVGEPVDGRITYETDEGATYFADQEDVKRIDDSEYEYSPDDFQWNEDWDMGDIGPQGAVFVDGDGVRRVASAMPPGSEWVPVFVGDEGETDQVHVDDILVATNAEGTPPKKLEWWESGSIEGYPDGADMLGRGAEIGVDTPGYDHYPAYEGPAEVVGELDDGYVVETPDGEEAMVGYHEVNEIHDEGFTGTNLSMVEGYTEPDDFETGQRIMVDLPDHAPVDTASGLVTATETSEYAESGNQVSFEIDGGELEGEEIAITNASDTNQIIDVDEVPEGSGEDEEAVTDGSDELDGESSSTTPSQEESESAVAEPASEDPEEAAQQIIDEMEGEADDYDLGSYDPGDVDEFRDMSDIGANHGNSVAAMDVAVLPDGSKMVHKDTSHHSVTEDDIAREMAGYEAGKHLDDNIPVHTASLHDGWAASEVVPGVDAKDATPEMKEAVDTGDFVEMAAVQVLLGNSDLHQNNVRVDEEGNLYPFDLDRSAGDVTGDWVGNLTEYDNTLDRILGELEKSATALGVDTGYGFRETVIEQASEIANSIDDETRQQIVSDVSEIDEEFGYEMLSNIDALASGEVNAP